MADNEVIGGVAVEIEGDYRKLIEDFQQAQQIAAQAGEQVASSFQGAAAQADTLEAKVQALVASGSTLAEALSQVEGAATATGSAVQSSSDALGTLGGQAEQAGSGVQTFGQHAHEAGGSATEAAEATGEFAVKLLEIAGITLSIEALKEFATEAVNVYAETERAQIALGLLTGDAEGAATTIEHLKDTAQELAVPFDSLVGAEQKMTAFGLSATTTQEAIHAAADAAAAVGSNFDSATAAIERMSLGGMAGARQLVQLGLSSQDLADVMGVSLGEVAAAFKSLDVEQRAQVLVDALDKYKGASEAVANSTSGALTQMANAWHFAMEDVGKAIAPAVTAVAHFASEMAYDFQITVQTMKTGAAEVGDYIKALVSLINRDLGSATLYFAQAAEEDRKGWEALTKLITDHESKTQDATKATHDYTVVLGEVPEKLDTFKRSLQPLPDDLQLIVDREKLWEGQHKKTLDEIARSGQTIDDFFTSKLDAANESMRQWLIAEEPIPGAMKNMADAGVKVKDTLESILSPLNLMPPDMVALDDALKGLGLDADGSSKKMADFNTILENSHSTLPQVEGAFAAVSSRIDKLAKTDLPAAIDEYDKLLSKLIELKAPEGEILDIQGKKLAAEIKYAEQSGTDAAAQIIALEQIKLKQEALKDSARLMGDLIVGVQKDILQGWADTGKAIADNIVDGKNWGDVFADVGKRIAKTILEDIIGTAFKALKDTILEHTNLLGGLANALGKIFGGKGATDAVAAAGEAAQTAGQAASVAGGAASAAGSAASATASTASSLAGTVSAIGSVVSAVTGIIGVFQSAKQETTLNAIEHNTRYTEIIQEQIEQGILWPLKAAITDELVPTVKGPILTDLDDMKGTLWAVRDALHGVSVNVQDIGADASKTATSSQQTATNTEKTATNTGDTVTAVQGGTDRTVTTLTTDGESTRRAIHDIVAENARIVGAVDAATAHIDSARTEATARHADNTTQANRTHTDLTTINTSVLDSPVRTASALSGVLQSLIGAGSRAPGTLKGEPTAGLGSSSSPGDLAAAVQLLVDDITTQFRNVGILQSNLAGAIVTYGQGSKQVAALEQQISDAQSIISDDKRLLSQMGYVYDEVKKIAAPVASTAASASTTATNTGSTATSSGLTASNTETTAQNTADTTTAVKDGATFTAAKLDELKAAADKAYIGLQNTIAQYGQQSIEAFNAQAAYYQANMASMMAQQGQQWSGYGPTDYYNGAKVAPSGGWEAGSIDPKTGKWVPPTTPNQGWTIVLPDIYNTGLWKHPTDYSNWVPSFDSGGPVSHDMLAMVHAGEFVLSRDMIAGRASAPSIPSARSDGAALGPITINVYETTNPFTTARRVSEALKTISPKFTAHSS